MVEHSTIIDFGQCRVASRSQALNPPYRPHARTRRRTVCFWSISQLALRGSSSESAIPFIKLRHRGRRSLNTYWGSTEDLLHMYCAPICTTVYSTSILHTYAAEPCSWSISRLTSSGRSFESTTPLIKLRYRGRRSLNAYWGPTEDLLHIYCAPIQTTSYSTGTLQT